MTGTGGAAEAALGTSVYDTTTFSGATTGFTPTASDISYQFNSVAAGSGLQSNTSAALGAGSYGYAVTFAGDSNYNADHDGRQRAAADRQGHAHAQHH